MKNNTRISSVRKACLIGLLFGINAEKACCFAGEKLGSSHDFVTGVHLKLQYLLEDRDGNSAQIRNELTSLSWLLENRLTNHDKARGVGPLLFEETKQRLIASINAIFMDLDGFSISGEPNTIDNALESLLVEISAFWKLLATRQTGQAEPDP